MNTGRAVFGESTSVPPVYDEEGGIHAHQNNQDRNRSYTPEPLPRCKPGSASGNHGVAAAQYAGTPYRASEKGAWHYVGEECRECANLLDRQDSPVR